MEEEIINCCFEGVIDKWYFYCFMFVDVIEFWIGFNEMYVFWENLLFIWCVNEKNVYEF